MKTWEREKEACSSGKMAEGCGYGCLYRAQVLGEGAYEIPLGFALTTLTGLGSLFAGACSVLWCVDLVVCCPLYTLCLPDNCSKTMDKVATCGMGCLMCGLVSASMCCLTAEKPVMCFPNLIAEEALNGWCHQPQYMLWKSQQFGEINKMVEDIFN